jgi:Glycosyl transferase WecG/TagA/CpsF family
MSWAIRIQCNGARTSKSPLKDRTWVGSQGTKEQAPRWMRENGLECLFRLAQEPRRLWRRYLLYGSEFAWNVSRELFRMCKR